MARDPVVAHTDDELKEGLWHVAAGGDLRLTDPLRAELVHLGLARSAAVGDALYLTPEGRRFVA